MIVARYGVPGKCKKMCPSRMGRSNVQLLVRLLLREHYEPSIVPYGTDLSSLPFPGTSYRATITCPSLLRPSFASLWRGLRIAGAP
jgi:hypothetical protein